MYVNLCYLHVLHLLCTFFVLSKLSYTIYSFPGVFWIDFDSLLKFFDVIYINWNPDLFYHTTCVHDSWKCKEGPKKDSYNIGDNPQFRLEVKEGGAVWILLTRHITDKVSGFKATVSERPILFVEILSPPRTIKYV